MRKLSFFLIAGAMMLSACNGSDGVDDGGSGSGSGSGDAGGDGQTPSVTEVVVKLGVDGLSPEWNLPKSGETNGVIAVQIYKTNDDNTLSPYAHGLFNDYGKLEYNAVKGDKYKIVATYVKNAETSIYNEGGSKYGKPFETTVGTSFVYDDQTELTSISKSDAQLIDNNTYTMPSIDRYHAVTECVADGEKNVALDMKRLSFGVLLSLDASMNNRNLDLSVDGAPGVSISGNNSGNILLYSFANLTQAYEKIAAGESYSENVKFKLTESGSPLFEGSIDVESGSRVVLSQNASGDFQITAEAKLNVLKDNLFYSEIPVGTTKRYRVTLENKNADLSQLKWYVDNVEQGSGEEFVYTAVAGNHTVSYSIPAEYSATGTKIAKSVSANVYTSDGVFILNEPNMTASENMRSVNKYTFGSNTVERFFITGDYTTMGTTCQYIANWSGVIYVISSYTNSGVAFSSFDAKSGAHIKSEADVNSNKSSSLSNVRAFAGVTPEKGVITTKNGAYIVNLNKGNFSIETTPLQGTESGAFSVFVTDGYVFIINSANNALAYKADELSSTATPVTLGSAKVGFVQSKDGYVWAANGSTLLKIDTYDLSVSEVTISAQIQSSTAPWKQVSWVASSKENVMYVASSSWSTASSVFKYDIDTNTVTENFLTTSDIDNHSYFYATSLYFEPVLGELFCSTIKGYGGDSAYNGLFSFDESGTKKTSVLYDTTDLGGKEMFFPAMMVPVKNFVSPMR